MADERASLPRDIIDRIDALKRKFRPSVHALPPEDMLALIEVVRDEAADRAAEIQRQWAIQFPAPKPGQSIGNGRVPHG